MCFSGVFNLSTCVNWYKAHHNPHQHASNFFPYWMLNTQPLKGNLMSHDSIWSDTFQNMRCVLYFTTEKFPARVMTWRNVWVSLNHQRDKEVFWNVYFYPLDQFTPPVHPSTLMDISFIAVGRFILELICIRDHPIIRMNLQVRTMFRFWPTHPPLNPNNQNPNIKPLQKTTHPSTEIGTLSRFVNPYK